MIPLLGKLALAYLGLETADALVVRRWWRRKTYRAALERARATGKPLLVVGRPQAGYINNVIGPDYGCGDVCTDIVGCSPCPREMRGPLEQILPRLPSNSHVIYVSCTLEYVDNLPLCAAELDRVAVPGGLFVVRVAPGSSTFWLWPGSKSSTARLGATWPVAFHAKGGRVTTWAEWLVEVRPRLRQGERVVLPADLPLPSDAGFTRYTGPTENHGQVEDWVHPLENGSRLHAYRYADGRWAVHLDNYDPNVSLLYMVLHLGSETSVGKLALLGGIGYLGYRWASSR